MATDDIRAARGPETTRDDDELKAFWTPERMAAAVPVEEVVELPPAAPAAAAEPGEGSFGQTRAPEDGVTASSFGSPAEPRGGGGDGTGTSVLERVQAFTTQPVDDPTQNPFCTAGRLYLVMNGVEVYASASVIGQNLLLTCAHALFDPGRRTWASEAAFVPAYHAPHLPFGFWKVTAPYVPTPFLTNPTLAIDYGACVTGPGGTNNGPVGARVGTFGVRTGLTGVPGWITLGYPMAPLPGFPFDGTRMWWSRGDAQGSTDPGCVSKDGNMTQGASGGPWLLPDLWVNGVQSTISDAGGGQYRNGSPYFDAATLAFLNSIPG